MQVVNTIEALRLARRALLGRVGAVYTMGALHAGHIGLVNAARAENDSVLTTIFINPLQFKANEDFTRYPRDLDRDLAMFEAAGVDLVFTPTPELMYAPDFQTSVRVSRVSRGLEGKARPGHFRGVATVVAKLFNLTQPDITYFGQKDAQQVVVIRQMARDLNFPLEIVVMPTAREENNLAMSSRNAYLSPEQRHAAGIVPHAIKAAALEYEKGERRPIRLIAAVREVLAREPVARVDYVAINNPRDLRPIRKATEAPLLLSLAVQVGTPRLLDNALLPYALNNRADLTRLLGGSE